MKTKKPMQQDILTLVSESSLGHRSLARLLATSKENACPQSLSLTHGRPSSVGRAHGF